MQDILVGGNNDKSGIISRKISGDTPYDFFTDDIPSPTTAQNKTRETFAIENLFGLNSKKDDNKRKQNYSISQFDPKMSFLQDLKPPLKSSRPP